MADTQIIGAKIQVDTGNSNANVATLNKGVGDLKGNLKDAGATASTTGKAIESSGGSFSKLKEQIAAVPGPLGEATEGVGTLNTALKAMLANPVVLVLTAIVAVLGLLYKAFENTFEGGEKMEQIFAGIKAGVQAVIDNITSFVTALLQIAKLDFSGAIKTIKGIGDAISSAYSQTVDLTKKIQELHAEQLVADVEAAKRQEQIAKLRELATDESVPLAKRKAALVELKKISEDAAKTDVELTRKTVEAKNALLTIEKDGALKNRDEIAKNNIEAIQKQTQADQEGRAIGRQLRQVENQEREKAKQDAAKAAEEARKIREQNQAYQAQLQKLNNENALAGITDTYAKEKQALENKIADEAALIQKDFDNKKLTRDQYNNLVLAQQKNAQIQRDGLTTKHQKDVADQEQEFQDALAKLIEKTQVDSITNQRQAAAAQLVITYNEQLAAAKKKYAENATEFQLYKQALDAQLKAQQDALDRKNAAEDAKKKLDDAKKRTTTVLNDPKSAYKVRQDAINAEQAQVQAAFDAKEITESEYNDYIEQLAQDRIKIRQEEQKQTATINNAIGDAFSTLSDIAGKQTVIGKGLAIASTTIKTFQGAISAFTGMVDEIPGPVGIALGAVAAAGAIASGIAAVKKIVAVEIPGQGSGAGGGSTPTGIPTPTAPVAPTQQSTQLNASTINSIGSATTAQAGRAYVLSGDVKSNADKDARLERAARLSGT